MILSTLQLVLFTMDLFVVINYLYLKKDSIYVTSLWINHTIILVSAFNIVSNIIQVCMAQSNNNTDQTVTLNGVEVRGNLDAINDTSSDIDQINQWICSICLDTKRETLAKTSCQHIFHMECIRTWMTTKHTCPLCRTQL